MKVIVRVSPEGEKIERVEGFEPKYLVRLTVSKRSTQGRIRVTCVVESSVLSEERALAIARNVASFVKELSITDSGAVMVRGIVLKEIAGKTSGDLEMEERTFTRRIVSPQRKILEVAYEIEVRKPEANRSRVTA